jgi:LPXTG-motif cell wall-anchored protein
VKALLSLILTLTLLVASETSAMAHIAGSYPPPPGRDSKDRYTVLEDGTLIYDGDMKLHCNDLARLKKEEEEQLLPPAGDRSVRQATIDDVYKERVEVCTKAGSPPSTHGGMLPDTGGVSPVALGIALALAVGLVLTGRKCRSPE